MRLLTLSVIIALMSVLSFAQVQPTLELNRQLNASAAYGAGLEVRVTSNPGAYLFVLFNMGNGPTPFLGQNLPLTIDSNLHCSHVNVPVPASGEFVDIIPIPNVPSIEGQKFFCLCMTHDQSLPFGFGISNGADVSFTRPASAGDDTAGLVGQPVTLDGGDNLTPGPMPAGQQVQWSTVSGPAGNGAVLAGADTPFPSFTADMPGLYEVECSMLAPGTTGGVTDNVMIEIYEVDVTSHDQGAFDTSDPLPYAGSLNGPPGATLNVAGSSTPNGAFSGMTAAGDPFTSLVFEVTAANGQKVSRGLTVVNNTGTPLTTPATNGVAINLQQGVLTQLETALEAALGAIDLSGPLTGIPTIPIANVPGPFGTTLFSADIDLTSFSYDPTIDVVLTIVPGAINVQLVITNLALVFDISGVIFNVPYMDVGTLAMTSLDLGFDLTTTASGGVLATTTSNETATINGATLTFQNNVIPSQFVSGLLPVIVPVVETTLSTLVPPLIPPLFDAVLAVIPQQIDLNPTIDAIIDLIPNDVSYAAGSLTIDFNSGVSTMTTAPGAPDILDYYTTLNPPPVYGTTIPGTTQTFDFAFALGDDFLNQLIAVAVRLGAFNLEFSGGIDVLGNTLPATAGTFSFLLPGLGFEKFDPNSPVAIAINPEVAPVARLGNNPMTGVGTLDLSDVELEFLVEVTPSHRATVASFGLAADADLDVTFDLMNSTLDLELSGFQSSLHVRGTMPGVDASPLVPGIEFLLDSLLPTLLGGLTSIPIPDLGLGLGLAGIALEGPAGDYLSVYFD